MKIEPSEREFLHAQHERQECDKAIAKWRKLRRLWRGRELREKKKLERRKHGS